VSQLSPNFALREFLRSQLAARAGRELVPPKEVIGQLTRLCNDVLEPLRVLLGRPVEITSGWRPEWLNTMVGGAAASAHLTGRAADIVVSGMPAESLARYIARHQLPADKCILEFGAWVHVQVSASAATPPRHQFLTARRSNGATHYINGLG
jgi:zinc D-Ala-D-Ala carboxypeptidase